MAPRAVAAPALPHRPDLAALEARHGGRLGVAIQAGDKRVQWRGAERFAYCSTFKLFLAAAILQRVGRGADRLDRAVPIRQSDMVPYAPTTGPAVGATLTVEQLCKAAVELSDNPAANILIRAMGGLDAWRAWYRALGDEVTRVDRFETELNSALAGDPRDTTTPAQAIADLAAVLTGDLLSPPHRRLLETWLVETPTGAGRIKAAVPKGFRVGHKTGTGAAGPANDIGIIWPPSGAPILIAVYFTECPNATDAERDAVVADAARAALKAVEVG
jgi:beta-lactamase class A